MFVLRHNLEALGSIASTTSRKARHAAGSPFRIITRVSTYLTANLVKTQGKQLVLLPDCQKTHN
jgi:hypothetical protein